MMMPLPLVISSPSGGGKSTLLTRLLRDYPAVFGFSVSHTTRKPRPGEENGKQYHFVDEPTFSKMVQNNEFVENVVFSGNKYGTSYGAVRAVMSMNKICIIEIEMQGIIKLKSITDMPAKYLFIQPPSLEILEKRLRDRKTESEESLASRLDAAQKELQYAKTGAHDHIIINDDVEKAYGALVKWLATVYGIPEKPSADPLPSQKQN